MAQRFKLEGRIVTEGLEFPEGPVVMPDGSVIVVEIKGQRLIRCHLDGSKAVVAELGGGPNGAAIGPRRQNLRLQQRRLQLGRARGRLQPPARPLGRLRMRLDPTRRSRDRRGRGALQRVRRRADQGPQRHRVRQARRVLLHRPRQELGPADGPRRAVLCGQRRQLHPRGRVPVDHTQRGRPLARRQDGLRLGNRDRPGLVLAGARARRSSARCRGRRRAAASFIGGPTGYQRFDSLAVEAGGNICVATLVNAGISVFAPEGGLVEFWEAPEPYCTNIAFGGPDLRKAYITLSGYGQLLEVDWPRPGLPLVY